MIAVLPTLSMNLSAVFIAALAAFVVGFLWHGPLFGATWMKLMGISKAEMEAAKAKGMGAMAPQMIAAFVQQFVMAAVVAQLAGALGVSGASEAVFFAAMLWLGFIATTLLNGVLWEKRKMELYLFNIAYHLVALVIMTLIVVLWR